MTKQDLKQLFFTLPLWLILSAAILAGIIASVLLLRDASWRFFGVLAFAVWTVLSVLYVMPISNKDTDHG